ncbi:putative alpha-amylase [Escherichia coli]|uniref:Putative alpha-amylase n=1 Tax=Escherichia coli TaxID=562 RepID=A0A377DN23_ECOLX|nr:alpha amylase domain protein [Shigella sonnei 53G]STM37528.1 putative alpha-amylase [Escherichia coli]
MGDLQDFIALVKDAKKFGIDIIPDYTFNFMGIGVVVKMTWIIPLLIYERRSVKI